MEISDKIKCLYDKDTKDAYANLQELEEISDNEDFLYPYLNEFIEMLKSEKYVIRVRGFRLLCKQAKWDREDKINEAIEDILTAVDDEKPTAVRQALQYLEYLVPYKKELNGRIKETALSIDCSKFKDTMQPLIEKDIRSLVQLIERWDKLDKTKQPSMEAISRYVNNPLWEELCQYIEEEYQISPVFEYSRCSMPGWNVKYRKAGRSLCTLYPMEGYFVALVVISEREKMEMESALPSFTAYLQQLYHDTQEGMGQKWLMIEVRDQSVLGDVRQCIAIRRKSKKR